MIPRWKLYFLLFFSNFLVDYCSSTEPRYYDPDTYSDCFQGAKGWYHLSATCIFPLTQFERNYSTAIQMCGAINHSIGYRETNWLIASQLMEIFQTPQDGRDLFKLYWTGLRIKDIEKIGVEAEDATEDTMRVSDFTSIYNPLWAEGQPQETLPTPVLISSCLAIDLRNSSFFGWRLLPCSTQLPILCQNYACLPDTFRCLDNSKCIPPGFVNDGFNDCLDGSDESGQVSPSQSSIAMENPIYEWPVQVSSGGILSPSTVRYGRGECTHKWTVLSPSDKKFVIWISWLSPGTSTNILIEGKDQNGTIFVNYRNSTSSISILSSSFMLTARDTDTRKREFQIHYQEIDPSLCHLSVSNRLLFDSSSIPMPCNYRFSTNSPDSYITALIKKCQGPLEVASFDVNNSTVTLSPSMTKKLLIFPANSIRIHVDSTWPSGDVQLEMQFFELKYSENLDVFMIDRDFEIEWIAKSEDVFMGGEFRELSVHMIVTGRDNDLESVESTWQVEKFRKTCGEDNVQLISKNTSTFLQPSTSSQNLSGLGPTSIIIHQSAEPFEFRASYSIPEKPINNRLFLDENLEFGEEENVTQMTPSTITPRVPGKANSTICSLPIVQNAYITYVSSHSYQPGTYLEFQCLLGFWSTYSLTQTIFPITCTDSGAWLDPDDHPLNGTITCLPIECSRTTPVEDTFHWDPDTYHYSYGTVRHYQDWSGQNFGPFCVCGDDQLAPTTWQCYNSGNGVAQEIGNACILPQVADAYFERYDATEFDVFPTGYTLIMTCFVCPNMQYHYKCYDGLWQKLDGTVQPYGTFKCKCSDDPDFRDPCLPNGEYIELSGSYSCKCNAGYKFQGGTCEDIDECLEGSSLCDPWATCHNTIGGFTCECSSNYHNYNSADHLHWSPVANYLIDGYSCVESYCNETIDLEAYGLNIIYPNNIFTNLRSGSSTPYFYITNLCSSEEPCVVPYSYFCMDTTNIPDRNVLAACPTIDRSMFYYPAETAPYFHIFDTIQLSCLDDTMIMIGRPYVFCNANAQWEVLPKCVYDACSDITQFINPPLLIDKIDNPHTESPYFDYRTIIHLKCESDEYRMIGSPITTCVLFSTGSSRSFIWNNDLPECIRISPTTTVTPRPPTSWFPFATSTSTSGMSPATSTSSSFSPSFGTTSQFDGGFNDVIIEDSVVFEETNYLEKRDIWTMSGDWSWSPSSCLLHQWTFPTSFLVTSTPIPLNSDEIELIIDITQCRSALQVAIFTTSDSFIPAISDFRTILNTTSSGSVSVKLRNLKANLAISIRANGFVTICGVIIREKKCGDVDFEGVHLEKSAPFPMRRYIPATCGNRMTTVNGYCDSRRGWVIQKTSCLCNPNPCPTTTPPPPIIHLRDQAGNCSLNSCENGICVQKPGSYDCECNEYFKVAYEEDGTPFCKPDHCLLTSEDRNKGYNCTLGENDASVVCRNSEQTGSFCQYEGELYNSTYTYILRKDDLIATAINVCNSLDTIYAIPNAPCGIVPSTTPQSNNCGRDCPGFLRTCSSSNPPYDGGTWCYCSEGWYGRRCDVSKFCFNEDMTYRCLNGGTCNAGNTTCTCLAGFDGDVCQNYIGGDNCPFGAKDCGNGKCRQEIDNIYCNCDDGWLKDAYGNCTIPWNMCSLNNPCQQNSPCYFDVDSGIQSCDCSGNKWGGAYCQVQPKLDDCSVCQNSANCLSGFTNNVRCQCEIGFSGDHCTDRINDCDFKPCLNNGICNQFSYQELVTGDQVESYNCTCPTGFSGTNCELTILKNCQDYIKCENGGTCEFDQNGVAICKCTMQFYGDLCQKACSDQCAHSYGCINNGSVYCDCYDGFSTQFCDNVDNVCTANILLCQNSGHCNSTTQSCDCTDSFFGTYCENNGNFCESHEIICENGGTCMPELNDFRCECPPNYTGLNCENQIHSCRDITCNNGGTCIAWNATCACVPGSTGDRCQDLGQPCKILLPNGTYTDYCMNNGKCLDLPNGAACDCTGTDFSGRRCETKADFNFNLVFNGMKYAPDIVSVGFSNQIIKAFTLCSFVQYNHPVMETSGSNVQDVSFPILPPYLSMRGYGRSKQIIFDNQGFFICDDVKKCSRTDQGNFKPIPITANTWHHFCIVSPAPENQTSPSYTVYLDGVNVWTQFAETFDPGENGYLYLAPSNLTDSGESPRFQGMISMTQLYIIRLTDKQIADLAFDCYQTISNTTSPLSQNTLIKWNGSFTRVSSSNPGVFVDPAGICKSVKCMFGRQVKSNNYNSTGTCDKDRIPPTVLRCPSKIQKFTTEDFTQVTWPDEDISFFDNIGVTKIQTNFHNGQQFGIGITTVRYIASDAAGNTAECSFDVIITQKLCPAQVTVMGGVTTTVPTDKLGPFVSKAITVSCDDNRFPCETRPKFYTCDIMGHYGYGGYVEGKEYFLPACGTTVPAHQSINGTVVGTGNCEQVYQKLQEAVFKAANCEVIRNCNLAILPPCGSNSSLSVALSTDDKDTVALQYTFSTSNSTETINQAVLTALQDRFSLVRQDGNVKCGEDFPIEDSTGNVTICVSCPGGTFANKSAEICTDCPIDTYRNPGDSDQSKCLPCPENTTTGGKTGSIDVSQCYKNCEIGEFENSGECVPCPEGTFSSVRGLQKCVCCGFDTSTFGGGKTSRSDCEKTCPSGQQMERTDGSVPICVDCPVGFYKQGSTGPCLQCPRGLTTVSRASKSIDSCSVLNCIDANTRRNTNATVSPETPYSELCITCEQGQFQNVSNADVCLPCSELQDSVTEIPVTCQSTCSTEVQTDGCHCGLQNGTVKTMNCLAVVTPTHQNASAIRIVLPVVFGALILIVLVVLFCYRKQIIAWFRKTDISDNQNVSPAHFDRPSPPQPSPRSPEVLLRPTIPRPNLRIVTSQEELDRLPPLPSSSTPSFHVDSAFESGFFTSSGGMRQLGTATSHVRFEANGSPKLVRNGVTPVVKIENSDDSSLDSFF